MTPIMPRQDSVTEQFADVAAWADGEGISDGAGWIRRDGRGALDDETYRLLCRIAVDHMCYDAHDWIIARRRRTS